MGGELSKWGMAGRGGGGAWTSPWREVEGPNREKGMRYRMDIICGKVSRLYGGKEERVWG